MATDFPLFTRLPEELRRMIWRETIPPSDAMMLTYNVLCGERDIPPEHFHVQIPPPAILSVSRESRALAHDWMAGLSATLRPAPRQGGHALTRPADWAGGDLMYVPREQRDALEGLALRVKDGRRGVGGTQLGEVRNLALPAFTAYYSLEWLVFVAEALPKLERVFVVWGELPPVRTGVLTAAQLRKKGVEGLEVEVPECRRAEAIVEEEQAGGEGEEDRDGEGKDEQDEDEEEGPGPVVTMLHQDPRTGETHMEKGKLGSWMRDLHDQLSITEVDEDFSERFMDDNGEITLDFVSIRMAQWEGGQGGKWREPLF